MIRVAVVQNDPAFGAKQQNVDTMPDHDAAVKADLYVLPSSSQRGYNFIDSKRSARTGRDLSRGDTRIIKFIQFCLAAAMLCRLWVSRNRRRVVYNSAAIVGPEGSSGLYRKVHLFDREKLFFAPGDLGFQVFDTTFGRIGIMICFDWYFPESARTLALKGAQIIAHPQISFCPTALIACRQGALKTGFLPPLPIASGPKIEAGILCILLERAR